MAARGVLVASTLVALVAVVVAGPPARKPLPSDAAAADSGKLPADILCGVYGGGSHCSDAGSASTPQRGQRPGVKDPAKPSRAPQRPHHRARRQDQGGDTTGLEQDQICSIFGGPTCPADETKVYERCECPSGQLGGCECVPYYQCDGATGEFNQDGIGIIDIRQKEDQNGSTCQHYLQQCCTVRSNGNTNPNPDPNPDPNPNPNPNPNPDPNPDPNPNPNPFPGPDPGPTNPNVPVPVTNPECGVRNRGGIGSRISGAEHDETQFGEIPWMVAVFRKRQSDREYLCGGGLIAPGVVLTAAHCVNDKTPQSLTIRAGEWDSRTEDEAYKHQDRDVSELIVHPAYKEASLHNDVALLLLTEDVRVGYHIGTICLPDQGQNFDRANCLVSGWGKDKFGKDGVYQNILRRIDDLPVVANPECQEKLRNTRLGRYFRLHTSFLCAGGIKGKDACTGDGGSPLVCPLSADDDARYVFTGIVSWGVGCGEEDIPGVYASVAGAKVWIDGQLSDRLISLPCITPGSK